jgi:septin family protein
MKINENKELLDCRIHLCLFFIRELSLGTKDYEDYMKELSLNVNVIPIITKVKQIYSFTDELHQYYRGKKFQKRF